MTVTVLNPTPFLAGFRMLDGSDLNAAFAFPNVAAGDGYVAGTTQTQAGATPITGRFNKIATVGTTADGVLLPKATPGASVVIYNGGANSATVYGNGSDTINDTAGSTGIAQGASTAVEYFCPAAGKWYTNAGSGGTQAGSFTTLAASGAVTLASSVVVSGLLSASGATVSSAGTNRATSTPLTKNFNDLGTVGSGEGVTLPAAVIGTQVMVANKGANNVIVYAAGSDTIDGTAGATGVTLGHTAGTNSCMFFCVAAATWISAKLGAIAS
jgi:hypothetical protein